MIDKIIETYRTSLFIALLSFINLWVSAYYLGAHGRGMISLLMANVSFVQIFSAIIGSSGLIYLTPRHSFGNLFILTYTWAFTCCLFMPLLLVGLKLLDTDLLWPLIIISLLLTLAENNNRILIAWGKVGMYNLVRVIQPCLISILLLAMILLNKLTVENYLYVFVIASVLALGASLGLIVKEKRAFEVNDFKATTQDFLKYGTLNQFNNLMQFCNYRFSYFLINRYNSISSLGVFSLALMLAEAVWLLRSSITTIHYVDVSKQAIPSKARQNNLPLAKLSILGTLVILVIAMVLPLRWYLFFFGKDFSQIKMIMLLLSPGVILFAGATVISHYFSGIGKIHFNTYSSGIGFATILITGFYLIPMYGIVGAAIANSSSYLTTAAVIFFQYKRHLKKST